MADMTNAIANFGMQAGQNIQNTVGNALARNEERRRYQNEMAIKKQEQDQLRQQAADAAEREYGKGWSAAYFSAPEDKRPLILQGGIQKAVQQGFLKPEEAQSISEDYMYRLAAETGVDFSGDKGQVVPKGSAIVGPDGVEIYRNQQPGGGPAFEGTGIENQMLNIILDPSIPDGDPRKELARQRLGRERTIATPEGTYVQPGYDLGALNSRQQSPVGRGATAVPRTGSGIPSFTPKTEKTPGIDAVDKEFAKEYVQWTATGGYADVVKQLSQLKSVSESLKSGKNLTGPALGRTPDAVRAFTNPDSLAARDSAEEVVQRNLRLILGAQFTQREGERLIARAYNQNLDEKENAKRIDRLIKQIETAAQTKADAMRYFEKNGTLLGWEGKLPTVADFMNMDFSDGGGATGSAWSIKKKAQ